MRQRRDCIGRRMMKSEIGSEFWDIPEGKEENHLLADGTCFFLSGRSALQAIIAENDWRTAALPDWCCESMIYPFLKAGIQLRFYPALEKDPHVEADAVLVMDYFGYASGARLGGIKGAIIRDVTHSLLSRTYTDADYYFGSLRKWAGFWTGGYAWTKDGHPLSAGHEQDFGYTCLREKAMQQKACYMDDSRDGSGLPAKGKEYLLTFGQAESLLEKCGIAPADERDVAMASKMDVAFIRQRRRSNASFLMDSLSELLLFPRLGEEDCPLFVPILVPDGKRDALRSYLISHDIYCPVHWPFSKYHRLYMPAGSVYAEELSLVCDQRYQEKDMARIAETVKSFAKGGS